MMITQVACGRIGVVAGLLLGGGAAVYGCFHLQSAGCGEGSNYCTVDQVYCDIGYGSTLTGCGRKGPMSIGARNCYKIVTSTTVPCRPGSDTGGYPTGCPPTSGGVCCFVTEASFVSTLGEMQVPTGDKCDCGDGIS